MMILAQAGWGDGLRRHSWWRGRGVRGCVRRVRLGKEDVEECETVSEEVRKERIEAEGEINDRRGWT